MYKVGTKLISPQRLLLEQNNYSHILFHNFALSFSNRENRGCTSPGLLPPESEAPHSALEFDCQLGNVPKVKTKFVGTIAV